MSHTQGSSEATDIQDQTSTHSSQVAQETMFPTSLKSPPRSSTQPAGIPTPTISDQGEGLPLQYPIPRPDCVVITKSDLLARGFTEDVADMAAAARRPGTVRTYSSRLTNYHQWCADTQIVPCTATVNQITDFFRHLFDQGKQWQSTWRSRTGFR